MDELDEKEAATGSYILAGGEPQDAVDFLQPLHNMKKHKIRCWQASAECSGGEKQVVYYTVPDFGDSPNLLTCPHCGALFAVDSDEEFYTKRKFAEINSQLSCPECGGSLKDALPYPQYFFCKKTSGARSVRNN